MTRFHLWRIIIILALSASLAACQPAPSAVPAGASALRVLAAESFLGSIVQQVAGDRVKVEVLMPLASDPHTYEPLPRDVTRVAEADLIFVNGAGFEGWLDGLVRTAATKAEIVEASAGITPRTPTAGEVITDQIDPHFWLNPLNVIQYVENIRAALSKADPDGSAKYAANATAFSAQLRELDTWAQNEVASLAPEKRLIVTDHESFGYFADHYGFRIIGAIIPSLTTEASPSAQQLAQLVNQIRSAGVSAIFLEAGANQDLARQIERETRVKVITDLYSHSLTPPDGPAPDYISMMRYNVRTIVDALK